MYEQFNLYVIVKDQHSRTKKYSNMNNSILILILLQKFNTQGKSNIRCPSELMPTDLFAKTKAYPYIATGMTPSSSNSTLTD